ncbi:MAG: aspartate kinase, partial [Candidatus Nitrosomaritimum yanchengensis]
MSKLVVAKFGGSAIGPDGISIPVIVDRINNLKKDSKVIAVFSAPLTIFDGKERSLTDVILEQGRHAENGEDVTLDTVTSCYKKILELVSAENKEKCQQIIKSYLEKAQNALEVAAEKKEFADETRSKALAFTGEILMSQVMKFILKSKGIICEAVNYENWPIITDNNIESTNFLPSESRSRLDHTAKLLEDNEMITIGGFIGRTVDGVTTTYERGGSDRTAADLGILFHKIYDTSIDFEKDSAVVSADPKVVEKDLNDVSQLSYNEARLAGMFGMKILDPIAIKEILENGVDIPIIITNMKDPSKITTIKRIPDKKDGHPIKIVTGKKNCAIFRIETNSIQKLLTSLEKDKRYSEFIMLSPFTKDGTEFSRMLFLDADYVKRNEKYFLGFDP